MVTDGPDGVTARERLMVWQSAEGAIVFAAGILIYSSLGVGWPWWAALLVFFAPDVSFAAYAFGPKFGSWIYNLLHVYGLGAMLIGSGMLAQAPVMAALGALWLGHVGFDRMLGYGLKSEAGFNLTHLGRIGRNA